LIVVHFIELFGDGQVARTVQVVDGLLEPPLGRGSDREFLELDRVLLFGLDVGLGQLLVKVLIGFLEGFA